MDSKNSKIKNQKSKIELIKIFVNLVFVIWCLGFITPVLAQVNFDIGVEVTESDEWIISEIASSRISANRLKVAPRESATIIFRLESFGKPVPYKQVKLVFEHESNLKKEVLGVTNEGGIFETTVTSNRPGKIKVTGYGVSEGKSYKILDEESIEILSTIRQIQNSKEAKVFIGDEMVQKSYFFTPFLDILAKFFR